MLKSLIVKQSVRNLSYSFLIELKSKETLLKILDEEEIEWDYYEAKVVQYEKIVSQLMKKIELRVSFYAI